MTGPHERGERVLLDERLTTAQRLVAEGKDRDGMHWLWAAASGLDGDPDQIRAVLAVAETTRTATTRRVVRSDCAALITRLEIELRKLGDAGKASARVQPFEHAPAPLPTASFARDVGRTGAYYLDDRLSVEEGICRFPVTGVAHEAPIEGFFVVAIRRHGHRECLFRFSTRDRANAHVMLDALNRASAAERAAGLSPTARPHGKGVASKDSSRPGATARLLTGVGGGRRA